MKKTNTGGDSYKDRSDSDHYNTSSYRHFTQAEP